MFVSWLLCYVSEFGRLGVLDEYVELCDLCLRFVFWAVHFLGAISKIGNGELGVFREESSSNRSSKEKSGLKSSCCQFENGRYVWTGVIWFCFVLLFFLSHFRNCLYV